jgi:hypothetical protein
VFLITPRLLAKAATNKEAVSALADLSRASSNPKFGGAAARATDTFGSKIDDLKISAGEAQENLGQGFITAAEIIIGSSNATDVFGAKLEQLGLNGGYIVIALADSINKIQDALSGLAKKIDSNPILRNIFNFQNSNLILYNFLIDV